jgi:hypothetical protein
VVAPASALLVWTDSRSPDTVQGKMATVWRTVGQTLRLGGEVGPPLRIVLSVLLALVSLLYVSTLVGLVTVLVVVYLITSLLIDLLYAVLDPRIRYA